MQALQAREIDAGQCTKMRNTEALFKGGSYLTNDIFWYCVSSSLSCEVHNPRVLAKTHLIYYDAGQGNICSCNVFCG